MLSVHEINTAKDFLSLSSVWNEVLQNSNDNVVTLTWEHIAVSVRNLEETQSLRILYVTNGDKIIAIAPLRKSNYKMGFLKYSTIEPLDYGVATDYTGLILAEQETECLEAILEYLFKQGDWDYLRINDIPEASKLVDILSKKSSLFPKYEIKEGDICPFISLPDTFDLFLNELKLHFKKELGRMLRSLERDHGKVEMKQYHELGSLKSAMQTFFDLNQKRWESQGECGIFRSPKIQKIFLDRAELFIQKDWLGLYFLTVNDLPVATNYTLKYNKKIHSCVSGFDPKFYSYGVSNLLLKKIIEESITQGYTEYDFMKGDEAYKFRWTAKYRRNLNLEFINSSNRSRMRRFLVKNINRVLD